MSKIESEQGSFRDRTGRVFTGMERFFVASRSALPITGSALAALASSQSSRQRANSWPHDVWMRFRQNFLTVDRGLLY